MREVPTSRQLVVMGCGRIGYWCSVALARCNIEHQVWDGDRVEGTGALGLPRSLTCCHKVVHLRGFISAVMGDSPPSVRAEALEGGDVIGMHKPILLDVSDCEKEERRAIWDAAKRSGADCWRVSLDGDGLIIEVSDRLPNLVRSGENVYRSRPDLPEALVAGGIAARVAMRLLRGERVTPFRVSLEEIFERGI